MAPRQSAQYEVRLRANRKSHPGRSPLDEVAGDVHARTAASDDEHIAAAELARVAHGVQLNDGTMVRPDAIIAATGFGSGLEPLVGHFGVLDDHGMPHTDGASATVSGLYFLGYEKGAGVVGPRAHRATRALCRELAGERGSKVNNPQEERTPPTPHRP